MLRIIMNRGFIARWTRMPHSTGRLSASASSHHSLSSVAFITNIAESDFRHAQVVLTARPAELDRHVLALDVTALGQASAECCKQMRGILRRARAHEAYHWHRALLRARRERPRSCAANQ